MITTLLRDPAAVLVACRSRASQPHIVRTALILIVVGYAIFGAAVGSHRGGGQIALSAMKLPLATLIALCAGGPAFAAFAAAFDRPWGLRATIAITLSAGARAALVLAALSPPLWLAIDLGAPYGATKLMATMAYGVAGLSGVATLLRALGPGAGRAGAAISIIGVYAVVGAQAAWLLRPYIGDPRDEQVPTFAAERKEGGLPKAIQEALRR